MFGVSRGLILLTGVPGPGILDHHRAETARQFHGSVRGAAIEYDDLVTASQTLDRAGDIALLVQRNDRGRDLHLAVRIPDSPAKGRG